MKRKYEEVNNVKQFKLSQSVVKVVLRIAKLCHQGGEISGETSAQVQTPRNDNETVPNESVFYLPRNKVSNQSFRSVFIIRF